MRFTHSFESGSQTSGTALPQRARCIIIHSKNLLYGKRHHASRIALSNPSRQAATRGASKHVAMGGNIVWCLWCHSAYVDRTSLLGVDLIAVHPSQPRHFHQLAITFCAWPVRFRLNNIINFIWCIRRSLLISCMGVRLLEKVVRSKPDQPDRWLRAWYGFHYSQHPTLSHI